MIPLLPAVAAAAAIVGVALNRRRVGRAEDREYATRFPAAANGIVLGGEGFELDGRKGCGLLLLHGAGDTPQSLRHLAEVLHAAGYTVHAPLLPGHGRSPGEFARATAPEYYGAATAARDALLATSEWVGVIGLSMGAALAARVAADSPDVRVAILLAPYVVVPPDVRWGHRTRWIWQTVTPFLRGRGERSLHDPVEAAENRAYGVFPARALDALVQTAEAGYRALPRLHVPVLVVHSETDNRISQQDARAAFATITAPSELRWVKGCGHIITADYCRDEVAAMVLDFLSRHAGR